MQFEWSILLALSDGAIILSFLHSTVCVNILIMIAAVSVRQGKLGKPRKKVTAGRPSLGLNKV